MRPARESVSPKSLMMLGVPRHLADKGLDDFDTFGCAQYEEAKAFFADYIENLRENFERCRGIYMYGSNGTGKTMLACVVVKEAYRRRYTARRTTFADYIARYTRLWSAKGLQEKEGLEEELYICKAAEFLVLEEVGKEIDSPVAAPILEDLARCREDRGLPTIICANLRMDSLRARYGESVHSLFKGNMVPVKMEGEDQRLRCFNERAGKGAPR